jgi:hypothetical protein
MTVTYFLISVVLYLIPFLFAALVFLAMFAFAALAAPASERQAQRRTAALRAGDARADQPRGLPAVAVPQH